MIEQCGERNGQIITLSILEGIWSSLPFVVARWHGPGGEENGIASVEAMTLGRIIRTLTRHELAGKGVLMTQPI